MTDVALIGLRRGGIEILQFLRDKTALIFSFGFPALLLLLFGTIFSDDYDHPGLSAARVFSASMIAYGIVSTAFITMGVGIATDREDGTLKRLRGTPVTAGSYFLGKLVLVAALTAAEVVVLLAVGVFVFDVPLPDDPGRWFTFGWLFVLSVLACGLLGIAASALVRSARTAGAVLNVPVVALQFLSGVFIHPITQLPDWMITVASIFPVKWMAQGFRSVFLPDSTVGFEAGGAWEHGRIALVLGVWCVVGLVLCLVTFRWTNQRDA
ncbi:ABC transporter permease [Actinoplanes friuliensis]|jgi:ABC-2 type transport system permease protein|uniref:Transport permease protein n=1 Tax=Actinoplanes friuliensis DSM 7358 TaxID=1246995 RepID=U5W7H1_9ACTN|nr:ABC transporter permease [Actinoplanes friuliensis]AGZ44962.1 Pleiotropic drug resistance protein 3 [Actinoplanes friuliensis DSM 7358]